MDKLYQTVYDRIEANSAAVLEAERHIWKNPESGFREWKTHAYLKEKFEALGYEVKEFGNIPGFYVDIETGRPGPKLAIFGELDSLIVPTHPECDPETGAVHACGHNAQCAALLGVAIGFSEPDALSALSGSIRLIAVPAEEGIEIGYRQELRKKGIIRYLGGKLEIISRGILDEVDLSFMIHTTANKAYALSCGIGSNGSVIKTAIFRGKSAHAGGSPHNGLNALYAANTALSAANAVRETFRDNEHIRFHPILTKAGSAVNAISDEVVSESYVRAASLDVAKEISGKMNRAFAGAAAALGCTVEFYDEHGFAPRHDDETLRAAYHEVGSHFYTEEQMNFDDAWSTGCTDMGDVSCIMPVIHPNISGACGRGHSDTYGISDPYTACVMSAKVQCGLAIRLLSGGASLAKKVVSEAKVPYASKEEFLKAVDSVRFIGQGVIPEEDGSITLHYQN